MNIVKRKLMKGISEWKSLGFRVSLIGDHNFVIPRIEVGKAKGKTVLIVSGLHLEETSGPVLLLSPRKILKDLSLFDKSDYSFIIYPLVNNFGLSFSEESDEKFLRYNKNRINYNDGWGLSDSKKTQEVKIVEEDILNLRKKTNFTFALSLHEDSSVPKKGYIWINGLDDATKRNMLIQSVKEMVDRKDLIHMTEKRVEGGKVEGNIAIVDGRGKGALEDWLAHDLNIPTILSEAPFGETLSKRIGFHKVVIKSTPLVL